MECLAIVAPMGRYSSCSDPTARCCRSAMCQCCGQSLPCLSPSSKRLLVSKVCSGSSSSSESSEERWLGSRSRGMRLRQKPRRNFKAESLRRLVTDIVLCAAPDIFSGVVQGKEGPLSATDSFRASPDRISGAAHPLREESSRLRYRDGQDNGLRYRDGQDDRRRYRDGQDDRLRYRDVQDGRLRYRDGYDDGSYSSWDGRRVVPKSYADESTWPGPGGREMAGKAGGRWFDPLDEGLGRSDRLSDSWNMQSPSEHGEGNFRDRIPGGRSEPLERGGHSGNWEAQQNYVPRHSSSNIPRSELLKIEELRFSGDMREGDAGPQVLNIQRALFWLGHLPGLSLTGYFGPETTRALQEFHYSNGLPSSGVWHFRSQQLLWKHLYPATSQMHPERRMPEIPQPERKEVPQHDLLESIRVAKNTSGKAMDDGLRASRALQRRHSKSLREFVASVSSSLPCPNVFSQKVGLLLMTVAVLSIVVKVVHLPFWQVFGQPVRKRVMGWRNSGHRGRPRQANQLPLNGQQNNFSEGGNLLDYFQNHLGRMSVEEEDRTGCNLLDRLVIFDGHLVRGNNQMKAKKLNNIHSQSGLIVENSVGDAVEGELSAGSSRKQANQSNQSGSTVEGGKKSHGLGPFQKLEADPARKVPLHSRPPVQTEKSNRLSGADKLRSGRSPDPLWASLVGFFLGLFFPNSTGFPYGRPKASGRRPVVRNTSKKTKSPDQGDPVDLGAQLGSSKFDDDGLAIATEMQRWKEENEAGLKKRVEELHRTIQSVEQTREAAMRALADEKMHNLELEVKIRRQNEAAAALEEEIRLLKDSHEALLASLKKKYSSSAAARAAAALLYQNWDPSDFRARV